MTPAWPHVSNWWEDMGGEASLLFFVWFVCCFFLGGYCNLMTFPFLDGGGEHFCPGFSPVFSFSFFSGPWATSRLPDKMPKSVWSNWSRWSGWLAVEWMGEGWWVGDNEVPATVIQKTCWLSGLRNSRLGNFVKGNWIISTHWASGEINCHRIFSDHGFCIEFPSFLSLHHPPCNRLRSNPQLVWYADSNIATQIKSFTWETMWRRRCSRCVFPCRCSKYTRLHRVEICIPYTVSVSKLEPKNQHPERFSQ